MMAVPSAPPTWRGTALIADARPDFSGGTAPMTESVDGAMTQPIETARPQNQKASGQYGMSADHSTLNDSSVPMRSRPAVTRAVVPTRGTILVLPPAPVTSPSPPPVTA